MVPNTLDSYKKLMKNYPWGCNIAFFLSYLISFKCSLILVSNYVCRISSPLAAPEVHEMAQVQREDHHPRECQEQEQSTSMSFSASKRNLRLNTNSYQT